MEVIQLTREHIDDVKALLMGQRMYFGIPVDDMPIKVNTEESVIFYANQYLNEGTHYYKSYGCYDGDTLKGVLNADLNQFMPYWIVRRLAVQEDLKGVEGAAVSQALISHATLQAESYGYLQHYSLVPTKYSRAHGRMWAVNPVRRGRYVVNELETIPAGEKSRFRMFWESLFGRTVYPIDTTVRFSLRIARTPYESGEENDFVVEADDVEHED